MAIPNQETKKKKLTTIDITVAQNGFIVDETNRYSNPVHSIGRRWVFENTETLFKFLLDNLKPIDQDESN